MTLRHCVVIFILLLMCCVYAFSQTLSGSVSDPQGVLSGVRVTIPALHRVSTSDDRGKYVFENVSPGVYTVEFFHIGYEIRTSRVNVAGDNVTLDVTMNISPLEFSEVTVTAKPQPSDIQSTSQSV